MELIERCAQKNRYQPKITQNRRVDLLMRQISPPKESNDPEWGNCPFLLNQQCTIYPVRPFGCRCLHSLNNCEENGYATLDGFVVTLNEVFLQFIEQLDWQGFTGNLTDVVRFLNAKANVNSDCGSLPRQLPPHLIANRPIDKVMVPPEHKRKIKAILNALLQLPGRTNRT
jgi:Fe-S-cluster containining protein